MCLGVESVFFWCLGVESGCLSVFRCVFECV